MSQRVISMLLSGPDGQATLNTMPRPHGAASVFDDEDFQLALWILYEMHYRGFEDVDPDLEWDPLIIQARGRLERQFEQALRELAEADVQRVRRAGGNGVEQLTALIEGAGGSDVVRFLQRRADTAQFTDFMKQRSIYHLKESDPQSFVLPRLDGAAKVALAELQYDEYGAGRPERLHSTMFADALVALGLDARYGAYVDDAHATTLAVNNTMSLFALRRRLRGAAMGHLAAFEATSSTPCRRILGGIERLGLPAATAEYFDEHIEADAAHEQVAIHNICGALVDAEPELLEDVLFGAASCLRVEELAGNALLATWDATPEARAHQPDLGVLA